MVVLSILIILRVYHTFTNVIILNNIRTKQQIIYVLIHIKTKAQTKSINCDPHRSNKNKMILKCCETIIHNYTCRHGMEEFENEFFSKTIKVTLIVKIRCRLFISVYIPGLDKIYIYNDH